MPTIHVIAPFNVASVRASSWFPYAAKVINLPKLLKPHGWRVVEYAAGKSESDADEHIELVTDEELVAFSEPDHSPLHGSPLWRLFDARLSEAFAKRPQPGDFVAHV